MVKVSGFVLSGLVGLVMSPVQAAQVTQGDLDPQFGTNGLMVERLSPTYSFSWVSDLAFASD